MNKEEILEIFEEECQQNSFCCEEGMAEKLLQTTEEFARSFEYELPIAYGIKGKITNVIKKIVRKATRFLTNPYATQMLKFQESICELQGQLIEDLNAKSEKLAAHEAAIYNLMKDFNKNANTTLDISNEVANIKQYLFGEEDNTFRSFSQAGEDAIISFILNYGDNSKNGISYLDIGCNRYNELNNSYHFYQEGVRGVLIDANPKFIDEIKKYRPEDTALNMGVGVESGEKMTFYSLNWDWLSSFNKEAVEATIAESPWVKIEEEIEVPIISMNDIFEKYFYTVPTVVSMDIEGDELAILDSIDMEKYRPLIYVIETINYSSKISINNKRNDIIELMSQNDYYEYAFTGINSIFIDRRKFD